MNSLWPTLSTSMAYASNTAKFLKWVPKENKILGVTISNVPLSNILMMFDVEITWPSYCKLDDHMEHFRKYQMCLSQLPNTDRINSVITFNKICMHCGNYCV